MLNIKNIIFDLGGVILNIDYQKTIDAFESLGISNFDQKYSQAKQSPLFDDLETGRITPDVFRESLRLYLNTSVSDELLDQAWNALLLDFPEERLRLLGKLKKKYRTFLLSNTNAIHYSEYSSRLQKQFGIPNLSSYFEKEYYSHEIGLRKPDPEVFEFVLNSNNLSIDETLFIDDSYQHIHSASDMGIQTVWLNNGKTIIELFKDEV